VLVTVDQGAGKKTDRHRRDPLDCFEDPDVEHGGAEALDGDKWQRHGGDHRAEPVDALAGEERLERPSQACPPCPAGLRDRHRALRADPGA
jgi:hypothetical protein